MIRLRDKEFNLEIKRKRNKNMYLRLKDEDTLVITCPWYLTSTQIYNFIYDKETWIFSSLAKREKRESQTLRYHFGAKEIYIFNKKYQINYLHDKNVFYVQNDNVFVSLKNDDAETLKYLYKNLDETLIKEACRYLNKYLPYLKELGYQNIPEIKTRCLKSKWGVCYTKRNKIVISSYLIHYPLECLEYIILHEMMHFIKADHSKDFYELIIAKLPDYKRVYKLLV